MEVGLLGQLELEPKHGLEQKYGDAAGAKAWSHRWSKSTVPPLELKHGAAVGARHGTTDSRKARSHRWSKSMEPPLDQKHGATAGAKAWSHR
jgi:hypothetical protein